MLELIYILFLLAVINFYLKFRMKDTLNTTEKFMISLMSIFLLFFFFYAIAYSLYDKADKLMTPAFLNTILIVMNLIMPIIATEIILAGYIRFVLNKKK